MSKQIRVSSVIILRWLENNTTEVFKNLSQLFKKYDKEKIGVSRRKLHDTDLTKEFLTPFASIQKAKKFIHDLGIKNGQHTGEIDIDSKTLLWNVGTFKSPVIQFEKHIIL